MAHCDGGVAMQQQHRHRLAHDVTAADHHGVTAGDRNVLAIEQLDYSGRRARDEHGALLHQESDVDRRQAVDVLLRLDRVKYTLLGLGAHSSGQRRLHEDAVVNVAAIEAIDDRKRLRQRRGRGQPLEIRPETYLASRLQLVTNVYVGRGIVAGQHDAQSRRTSVLRDETGHLGPDLVLNGPGKRLAVEHASAHATTPFSFSSAFTLSVRPSTTSSSPGRITASGGGLNSIDPPARLIPTTITPNFCRMPASTMLWFASAESSLMCTCSIDRSRRSELVASCTKSTTAGRSAVCTICVAPI